MYLDIIVGFLIVGFFYLAIDHEKLAYKVKKLEDNDNKD